MITLPPELAANYEILSELHAGGMGVVYKARHRHLDELCVIKVMHARLKEHERFLGEAKKGKQLRHPNIAEVLNYFVGSDDTAYLVMEYVAGQNLRELLAVKGPLDPRLVVRIALQSLAALGALHAKHFVHRDISPDNLMYSCDSNGEPLVKLIDLGIAKSLDETSGITDTGVIVGNLCYAPPEQFAQKSDARTDLYSLGVVLYELLTGVRPIQATDTAAILAAIHSDAPPRSFDETDPAGRIPAALRAVVLKAIEKKPEKRYQSAAEFIRALESVLTAGAAFSPQTLPATTIADAGPAPTPAPSGPPETPVSVSSIPAKRSNAPWGVALAAVLLVVISAFAIVKMVTKQQVSSETSGTTTVQPASTDVTVTAPPAVSTNTVAAAAVPPNVQRDAQAITRGKNLASSGRMSEAYREFHAAVEANPQNAYAWANLCGAASLIRRRDEAREACERALSIDSDNWLAHYNLACQLAGAGNRDAALEHLTSAMAQLKRQARSREELDAVVKSMRSDEALGDLRNDPRFTQLLVSY